MGNTAAMGELAMDGGGAAPRGDVQLRKASRGGAVVV